ncbi:MAG: HlyD family secretion protein [Paracoccaceae bacterium]|nr:HlyD family secretion protein [Paracoccaceae bacterium]
MLAALRRSFMWVMRKTLLVFGPVVVMLAGLYFYVSSGRYVTTENAYVKADMIIVAPEISGRVTDVLIADNQMISPGDVLFRIDPERFEAERARRAAQLASARQNVAKMKARHRTRSAEFEAAKVEAEFERDELSRSEKLRQNGTISEFRLLDVRRESDRAANRIAVMTEQMAESLVELGGDPDMPTDLHPDVMQALAELRQAELDLDATTVRARSHAVAANVRLQPGEYVGVGDPVLSLVGTEAVWVIANLKETDLTHLKVGQTAELEVDAYPGVVWQAALTSLSPATGAEYALLPAQNASGNWVKVVQRVAVRLDVEPQGGAPELRAGMSVAVSIDTGFERPLPDALTKARAMIPAADQP